MTVLSSSMIIKPNEQWACFECRKVFRQPSRWRPGVGYEGPEPAHLCPQCRGLMINVGRYFEAPRQQKGKQWQLLQFLADKGYRWSSDGAKVWADNYLLQDNPNLEKLAERLSAHSRKSDGEKLLEAIRGK